MPNRRGAVALLCAISRSAMATTSPEYIEREQQQKLDEQRLELLKRPEVSLPPLIHQDDSSLPVDTGPCFSIHRIVFEGAPSGWLPTLEKKSANYSGQCLGMASLQSLVKRLTNAVIDQGFVTSRIYLPEQNLASGHLRLVVVPGKIGEIHLSEGGADRSLRAAFPTKAGEILNIRDLEQGLEQLSRARSQRATLEIRPGAREGESDVVVKRERRHGISLTVSIDDSGQAATGKHQGAVTVALDNLLGINDVVSLAHSQDLGQLAHPRSKSDSVSWLLPWRNWTGLASYSESAYRQWIHGSVQSFKSSGHTRNTLLSLSRVLMRDGKSKTDLSVQLTRKASRSYIAGAEIAAQQHTLTLIGMELTHGRALGGWSLDGSVAYSKGVAGKKRTGGSDRRPEFYTGRLRLNGLLTHGAWPLRLASELRGQYSPVRLMGPEQFSIGSRYSVRGFDTHGLAGQGGIWWRNEIALKAPPHPLGNFEPFLGLDAGRIFQPVGEDRYRSLSGWAAGVRFTWLTGLSAELVHEQALHQPVGWPRPAITRFRLAATF